MCFHNITRNGITLLLLFTGNVKVQQPCCQEQQYDTADDRYFVQRLMRADGLLYGGNVALTNCWSLFEYLASQVLCKISLLLYNIMGIQLGIRG